MDSPRPDAHESTLIPGEEYRLQRRRHRNTRSHTNPLGPVIYRIYPRRTDALRKRAAVVLGAASVLLIVSAWVTPNPSGVGTHAQLGFPPCGLMVTTGWPCPTCGMTTAYAHAVRGQLITAFQVQPFGALLAMLTITAAILAGAALYTGRAWWINWYRLSPGLVAAIGLIAFLGAWAYKIITIRGWPGS